MNLFQFPFQGVEGHLSAEDRVNLKMLSERQSNVFGSYFEIGSLKGLSALCILSGVPVCGLRHTLHCFDWFEDDKYDEFWNNLKLAGYDDYWIVPHRGDFKKAVLDKSALFALGFIDHSHTLTDTKAAYEMFWPRLSVGGVLAFHDYNHELWPEATAYLDTLPHKRILEGSILAFVK